MGEETDVEGLEDLCEQSLVESNVSSMDCEELYATEDAAGFICNVTASFERSGGNASFRTSWHLSWTPNRSLDTLDARVLDRAKMMEGYLTAGEKMFFRLAKQVWLHGVDADTLNATQNVSVALVNLFSRPVRLTGPQAIEDAFNSVASVVDSLRVVDLEPVWGNDSAAVAWARVIIGFDSDQDEDEEGQEGGRSGRGRERRGRGERGEDSVERLLWVHSAFDNAGNLSSILIDSNLPILFWNLPPGSGLDRLSEDSEEGEDYGYGYGYDEDDYFEDTPALKANRTQGNETSTSTAPSQGQGQASSTPTTTTPAAASTTAAATLVAVVATTGAPAATSAAATQAATPVVVAQPTIMP